MRLAHRRIFLAALVVAGSTAAAILATGAPDEGGTVDPVAPALSRAPRLADVPPAPRRPSALARDIVFAYRGTQAASRTVGIIFLAAGLALAITLGWRLPVDLAIAASPATATAEVLSAKLDRTTRIFRRHPTHVGLAYEAGGARRTGEAVVLEDPPSVGARVTVEYATFAPALCRLAGTTRNVFGWRWGALAPMIVVAIGAALLGSAVRSNRREVQAFTHGRPILARVTFRGQDTSLRAGNGRGSRPPWVIRWEFRTPAGEVVEGSLSSSDPDILAPFGDADEVIALYDPEDPQANTLYVE